MQGRSMEHIEVPVSIVSPGTVGANLQDGHAQVDLQIATTTALLLSHTTAATDYECEWRPPTHSTPRTALHWADSESMRAGEHGANLLACTQPTVYANSTHCPHRCNEIVQRNRTLTVPRGPQPRRSANVTVPRTALERAGGRPLGLPACR